MFVPEDNFKFLVLWKQIGPLCTGECEKLACIAEILMTLGVLRWQARFFVLKRCSFDVTGSEKTLLVTLYNRVVPNYPNWEVAKSYTRPQVLLGQKMHGELILDPYMAPKMSWPSSCVSYSQGEVGSILVALGVPYTPEKNYTYQNHKWTTTFVTKIFFCNPPY